MANRKIDTHAHFICPPYREALLKYGHERPDGIPFIPDWSPELHLDFMAKNGIAKSILSPSSPGTHLVPGDDQLARSLSRRVNEYASDLAKRYPEQFGFFASLPLPDIQGSIAEIDYALDILKCDGFMLLSNHHGHYLGDPLLKPVLAKLNERKAVTFVHPTMPCNRHISCKTSEQRILQSSPLADCYLIPGFEFTFDSTRSFSDLILSGTAAEFPEIKWIVSHCGLALPSVLDRVTAISNFDLEVYNARRTVPVTKEQVREMLNKHFWFDLAGDCLPNQIHALLRWVGSDRLIYGSDMPWTSLQSASKLAKVMEEHLAEIVPDTENVYHVTATRLLHRVAENVVTKQTC